MTTPIFDALRDRLAPLLPLDYEWQFAEWRDTSSQAKAKRFAVIKPAGGGLAGIVRTPQMTLSLIGRDASDRRQVSEDAEAVVKALQHAGRDARGFVFMAAEPTFIPTADSRPVFELAISSIAP